MCTAVDIYNGGEEEVASAPGVLGVRAIAAVKFLWWGVGLMNDTLDVILVNRYNQNDDRSRRGACGGRRCRRGCDDVVCG
jgi:hypothetical protein